MKRSYPKLKKAIPYVGIGIMAMALAGCNSSGGSASHSGSGPLQAVQASLQSINDGTASNLPTLEADLQVLPGASLPIQAAAPQPIRITNIQLVPSAQSEGFTPKVLASNTCTIGQTTLPCVYKVQLTPDSEKAPSTYQGQVVFTTTGSSDTQADTSTADVHFITPSPSILAGQDSSTYLLNGNGQILAWGHNEHGQIGNGAIGADVAKYATVLNGQLTQGRLWQQISKDSDSFVCAIASNGKAYCWGNEAFGELGNGQSSGNALTPQLVQFRQGFYANGNVMTDISADYTNACALDSNGSVYCWGKNKRDQLARNHSLLPQSDTPVKIKLPNKAISIGTGYGYACALTSTYHVYCWGWDHFGQLGNGQTNDSEQYQPQRVKGLSNIQQVSVGDYSVCALNANHHASCWGEGNYYELGNEANNLINSSPQKVYGDIAFSHLSVGAAHVCGISKNGHIYCWGNNDSGQSGYWPLTRFQKVIEQPTQVTSSYLSTHPNATALSVSAGSGTSLHTGVETGYTYALYKGTNNRIHKVYWGTQNHDRLLKKGETPPIVE